MDGGAAFRAGSGGIRSTDPWRWSPAPPRHRPRSSGRRGRPNSRCCETTSSPAWLVVAVDLAIQIERHETRRISSPLACCLSSTQAALYKGGTDQTTQASISNTPLLPLKRIDNAA